MDNREAKNILKEARIRINDLMAQEKWVDAHRACLEILRFDPENIQIIRLKNRIEKNVRKLNRKALKDDMKKLIPLWKQEKYEEIMPYLKKLEPYAADYAKLNKFILRVQEGYKKYYIKSQKQYFDQELNQVEQFAAANNFQEAVRLAEKLRTMLIREAELKKMIVKLKERWISFELAQNKSLLESEKYEDILLFLQGLLRIDYNSQPVKKLVEKAKKEYQKFRLKQKKELIDKELGRIKTMFKLAKYDLAADAAKDILEIDPFNKVAKRYLVKSQKKAIKKQDRDVRAQMKSSRTKLKDEYKKDKKDFLKI